MLPLNMKTLFKHWVLYKYSRLTHLTAITVLLSGLCMGFLGTGCVSLSPQKSLYEELGELPGITLLVDRFIEEIAADERIVTRFRDTNVERFRSKLIEQFCVLSGGPCEYTGKSMQIIHGGLMISEAEFNALVEDLISAMEQLSLNTSTQNRLLKQLAPLRAQIIYQ